MRGATPGDYDLEIKGFSSLGEETNTLHYKIHIAQVFYKKSWFIILLLLSVISVISYGFIHKRRQMQTHYQTQSKLLSLESKALRAQMNPHFLFNALNGIQNIIRTEGELENQ